MGVMSGCVVERSLSRTFLYPLVRPGYLFVFSSFILLTDRREGREPDSQVLPAVTVHFSQGP